MLVVMHEGNQTMTRQAAITFLSVIALMVLSSTASARTWTDRKGRTVDAEFVAFKDGKVKIRRKTDGLLFDVPLEQLSDADQAFVKSQTAQPKARKSDGVVAEIERASRPDREIPKVGQGMALPHTEPPESRKRAVEKLAQTESPEGVVRLISTARFDRSDSVREAAIQAILGITKPCALRPLLAAGGGAELPDTPNA